MAPVNFEEKYFEKMEQDLKEVREQLQGMEDRFEKKLREDSAQVREQIHKLELGMEKKLDQAIAGFTNITKTRQDDYRSVNKRLDDLAQRIDKTTSWAIKLSVGTFIAVAGLVFSVLIK